MNRTGESRVVGLLGVGFDHEDGQIRITRGEGYQVLMGSGDSHHQLQKMCFNIEKAVHDSGRELSDYTPEEFMELMETLY